MNFNKKLAVAVSGAVLLMAGQFALADSTTDIVDALVSKGVLTEEEGKLISKGHVSKTSTAPVVSQKDGAFKMETPNGKNSIQLTGRMHFDTRINNINSFGPEGNNWGDTYDRDSNSVADQFVLRRARIGVKGRLGGIADYEVVTNLVGGSTNTVDVAFVDVNKYEPLSLRLGRFKQPYNLEELTSSNNIDFVERSYINQNAPGKKLGAMLHGTDGKGITYSASLFKMNDAAISAEDSDWNFAGRGTVNFAEIMGNKEMIMHVGLAGYHADYHVNPTLSNNTGSGLANTDTRATVFGFRSGGGGLANAYRAQIGGGTVGTGFSYGDSSNTSSAVQNKAVGLEAIVASGPFKVQGEYSMAKYDAKSGNSTADLADSIKADVDTAYIEAMWMLTGETYASAYKKGVNGLVKPNKEFDFDTGKGIGAWEIGLRYDMFDVSGTSHSGTGVSRFQGAVVGGAGSNYEKNQTCKYVSGQENSACNSNGGAQSYTAGVKWTLNPNMLVKLNYTYTKFDTGFKPIDLVGTAQKLIDHEDLLMLRTQFMF